MDGMDSRTAGITTQFFLAYASFGGFRVANSTVKGLLGVSLTVHPCTHVINCVLLGFLGMKKTISTHVI